MQRAVLSVLFHATFYNNVDFFLLSVTIKLLSNPKYHPLTFFLCTCPVESHSCGDLFQTPPRMIDYIEEHWVISRFWENICWLYRISNSINNKFRYCSLEEPNAGYQRDRKFQNIVMFITKRQICWIPQILNQHYQIH